MPNFYSQVLKHGIPTMIVLGGLGYVMAQVAGIWQQQSFDRSNHTDQLLTSELSYRLPLTMALWGLGSVIVFEAILSLWRKPISPIPSEQEVLLEPVDAEKLLEQLLNEVEQAEYARLAEAQAKHAKLLAAKGLSTKQQSTHQSA